MSRHSVSVDVDIAEFDDDAIVEEVVRRKLVPDVLRAHSGQTSTDDESKAKARKMAETVEQIVGDAQEHLMARRHAKARETLRRALAMFVPVEIVEAIDHVDEGRLNAAICEIERFLHPSPAVTVTTYPKAAPSAVTQ